MTIDKLQRHWWYRLVKVFYIVALGATLLLGIALAADNGVRTIDPASSLIICAPDNAKVAVGRRSFANAPADLTIDQISLYVPTYAFDGSKLNYKNLFQMRDDILIKTIAKTCNAGYSKTFED